MRLLPEILSEHEALTKIRREIHKHPELAFEENRTAQLIVDILNDWKIFNIHRGFGKTGVVATIEGTKRKHLPSEKLRSIGLRADMDGLPLQEKNYFAHSSIFPGKMHACGHDGHIAMLLGAAHYLVNHKQNFAGLAHLIFQPAEESGGGAKVMLQDGLFKLFPCQAVFAMHNWPKIPAGHFGVRSGSIMASSNEFEITIHGKGAHAALPHTGIDPIFAACQMVNALQSVITRNKSPVNHAVLSITQIHAGDKDNIIPDTAKIAGTVRTFDLNTLDLIEHRMRQIATHTAAAHQCSLDFRFDRNYPATINHEKETHLAIEVMKTLVADNCIDENVSQTMGSEDFSFMLQAVAGCYIFIGNDKLNDNNLHDNNGAESLNHCADRCVLHSPNYDFNDAIIPLGSTFWVKLVETYLH